MTDVDLVIIVGSSMWLIALIILALLTGGWNYKEDDEK